MDDLAGATGGHSAREALRRASEQAAIGIVKDDHETH
jgi:hypothetical protein